MANQNINVSSETRLLGTYRKIIRNRYIFGWIGMIAIMVLLVSSCDTFTGAVDGEETQNFAPIAEFANIPADGDTFSYAPVINWKGRDADGFIESFMYADITDSTALLDPIYYIDFIPEEAWVRTEAGSDTVYLLTEPGAITQHIFYLKCIDDKGLESDIKRDSTFRRFYRSNQQPFVPEIKWFSDADTRFGHDIPAPDADSLNTALSDTLYCLDDLTDNWKGLGFNWRSADPDDRALYTIPLEYRYYLERVPHDTVWQWSSPGWSSKQELLMSGLETGHYILSVWARDDGDEVSPRPATATFDVYKPTYHQSILLLNTSAQDPAIHYYWNQSPGTAIGDLYQTLVSDYPDAEYNVYTPDEGPLPKAYLGRFRLIIWISENETSTFDHNNPDIIGGIQNRLVEYVEVGGRLWVQGMLTQTRQIVPGQNTIMDLAQSTFLNIPQLRVLNILNNDGGEFTGATSGVMGIPDVKIDTAKTAEMYRVNFDSNDRFGVFPLLPGVDVIAAGRNVETVYYYNSYTDTASGDVWNDIAIVKANVDTIYYPPTPVDCIIQLNRNRVLKINRVYNATRSVVGDTAWGEVLTLTNNVRVGAANFSAVAKISYEYGEPWGLEDIVVVDYEFQPYSQSHLAPCAIRYENLLFTASGSIKVDYRVAVFTFPLYYLDNSPGIGGREPVTDMFNSMLDWFFYPAAH